MILGKMVDVYILGKCSDHGDGEGDATGLGEVDGEGLGDVDGVGDGDGLGLGVGTITFLRNPKTCSKNEIT